MSLRKAIPYPEKGNIEANDDGQKWLELVHQRVVDWRQLDVTFDPASVAANTTVEQTVEVSGIKAQDIVIAFIKPSLTAGLGVLQARVSADDTLAIQLINATASPIDAGSEIYNLVYIKNSKV